MPPRVIAWSTDRDARPRNGSILPHLRPAVRALGTAALAGALAVVLAATVGGSGSAAAPAAAGDVQEVATVAGKGKPLLPNMKPLRAADISITGRGAARQLRFETALANVGRGPMEVRPNKALACPPGQRGASQIIYRDTDGTGFFKREVDTQTSRRASGCMVFHPTHNHWHFDSSSFYALRPARGSRPRVSAYRKTSFCLRDSRRVPEHMGTFHQPLFYGECSRDRPMGVNIGWADVYQSFLDGQSLTLGQRRKVPNGRYCLTIRVDPNDSMRESDETDNVSARAIAIRGTQVTPLPNRVCR
jgi:hypothetical protein